MNVMIEACVALLYLRVPSFSRLDASKTIGFHTDSQRSAVLSRVFE